MVERINEVHPEIDAPFTVVTEWKPKILLDRKVEERLPRFGEGGKRLYDGHNRPGCSGPR